MSFNVFYLYVVSGLILSALIGWLIASLTLQKRYFKSETERINNKQALNVAFKNAERELNLRQKIEQQLANETQIILNLNSRIATAEERLTSLALIRQECKNLNHELVIQRDINNSQGVELEAAIIRLEENKLAAEEKQRLLIDSEQRLAIQFENLANRIFEHSGKKINEQNRSSIDSILVPLREQLERFKRQIQDRFSLEERERHSLSHEINNLHQLNIKITQETINLTRALKGNNKIQGNWGEMVLNRILESSGMREGYEFHTKVSGIQRDDGRRLQPDVIVHLPNDKDIVIDAKMSLLAYERYFNNDNDTDRQSALNEHINSLRTHIKLLGKKDYHTLSGIRTLDYVLMFVPIEPAFITAINQQPELINEAMKYNVMLVSPTTLLVALRTINNLWRYEHQNRNSQKIAKKAATLYDKIRLFIEDINKLGLSIDRAKISYQLAKNKLMEGNNNIISQVEGFRFLGVEVKRPIMSNNDTIVTDQSSSVHQLDSSCVHSNTDDVV